MDEKAHDLEDRYGHDPQYHQRDCRPKYAHVCSLSDEWCGRTVKNRSGNSSATLTGNCER
jgi:hypothetical protein